jgi:hypothetical protein
MPDQKELYRAYLSIAVFCEKVLREADGVMSIIRMIDRFNIAGSTPEMQPTVLTFNIFVSFKSGFLRGKQVIALRPTSPSGDEMAAMQFPVLFEGDNERGNALLTQMNFIVDQEGLYWFDVILNQEIVTRMPLRVAYQHSPTPMAG